MHNWIISNLTTIKDGKKFEENNKKMKSLSKEEESDEEDLIESE